MKQSIAFFLGLLFLVSPICWGQEKENETAISVQLRPRAEYRNGSLMPRNEGASPAFFINNRARLSLTYKRSNLLEMKFSAQHVGVWGQDPQIDKNGRFILNEAWARINMGAGFFAQLGRQGLVYDDERILGGLDWNVAGRFHDALKLGYENSSNKLHLILAYNQNDEKIGGGNYYAPGAQPYKMMQTLWYQYADKRNPFGVSLLAMNLGMEGNKSAEEGGKTNYMQTLGTNLSYKLSDWKIDGIFYYQTGKTAGGIDVSAWMASLKAGGKFNSQWGASVGTDYLSGDKEGDKFKAFNPLYGTHHKFYGAMDYFYASNFINGYNPGLWDLYAGLNFAASGKTTISMNYHYFQAASKINDPNNEDFSKGLGSEIDLQVDWQIMKDVRLSAGYSVMFGTETMDLVKGGNHDSWQDWGWLSININPQILHVKW